MKNNKFTLLISILAFLQAPGIVYAAPVPATASGATNNSAGGGKNLAESSSMSGKNASAATPQLSPDKVVLNFELKCVLRISG